MSTWIALFRGINVGGKNSLPMAELRSALESIKLTNVRTYIQSGNVAFDSSAKNAELLSKKIATAIEKQFSFKPKVFILGLHTLQNAVADNPFPDATTNPKTLHFYFLAEPAAAADTKAINTAKTPSEHYKLTDSVFYLHTPDGMARSKLGAKAEKYLGVACTARNYCTVEKLLAMVVGESS